MDQVSSIKYPVSRIKDLGPCSGMNDHPGRDTDVRSRPSESTIKDLSFYQSEGGQRLAVPRTAYVIPGRVGLGRTWRRRVRFRFRFRPAGLRVGRRPSRPNHTAVLYSTVHCCTVLDLGPCFGMNDHFRRDPDVISRLPESTIDFLLVFLAFRS